MLNSYYTEALLGIKDAIISKVEKRSQEPIIDIWFSLKTVSYTHLDVYKRQGRTRFKRFA